MNKDPSNSCGCSSGNDQQTACTKAQARTETTVFQVSNMDCRNEEALVRRTLEAMPGVQRLDFDLPRRQLTVEMYRPSDGRIARFPVRCRIDTPMELEYFKHGGVLNYVLRSLAKPDA